MTKGRFQDGKIQLPMAKNSKKVESGEALVMLKPVVTCEPTPLIPTESGRLRKKGKHAEE